MQRGHLRRPWRVLKHALWISLLGWGLTGCLPAFQGLRPVPNDALSPKSKASASAEILFWERKMWLRGRRLTDRNYMRLRINSKRGLSAATLTLYGGELQDLKVRTTCPGKKPVVLTYKQAKALAAKVSPTNKQFKWSSSLMGRIGRASYQVTALHAGVGCVIDAFWEQAGMSNGVVQWPLQHRLAIRNAHLHMEYDGAREFRASLYDTARLWMKLARQRKTSVKSLRAGVEPGKAAPKDSTLPVRLVQDIGERSIELYLHNIPAAMSSVAARGFAKRTMLPPVFGRTPICRIQFVRSTGFRAQDYLVHWKNIDSAYTQPSSWLRETRTAQQRRFQLDEEEELAVKGLAQIARAVTRGKSGRVSIMKALYQHLQQRMVVTRAGATSSGLQLRMVYKAKQGSAYEINMIYVVMLRAAGIRAYPALTAKGNRLYQDGAPDNTFFNGMVAYVPPASEGGWKGLNKERELAAEFLAKQKESYDGGRRVTKGIVLNPAGRFNPWGSVGSLLQGTHVFVLDGAGGRFYRIPVVGLNASRSTTVMTLVVAADGSVAGKVVRTHTGEAAVSLRGQLFAKPKRQWFNIFAVTKYAKSRCHNIDDLKWTQAPNVVPGMGGKALSFGWSFSAPHCVVHGNKNMLVRPFDGNLLPSARLHTPKRALPIELGTPGQRDITIYYQFPQGYKVLGASTSRRFKAPGLDASVQATAQNNKLTVKISVARKLRTVLVSGQKGKESSNAYQEIRKFFKELSEVTSTTYLVQGK